MHRARSHTACVAAIFLCRQAGSAKSAIIIHDIAHIFFGWAANASRFPCGRWLGSSIDDGSAERLLVGQLVPRTIASDELVETCKTPPRARSPSIHRPEIRPSDIQHMLGDCVNAIVKWHYRSNRDKDPSTLTNLLCGEDGLVKCMENAFLYGFKSQRLFGRNFYIWDFLGKW